MKFDNNIVEAASEFCLLGNMLSAAVVCELAESLVCSPTVASDPEFMMSCVFSLCEKCLYV